MADLRLVVWGDDSTETRDRRAILVPSLSSLPGPSFLPRFVLFLSVTLLAAGTVACGYRAIHEDVNGRIVGLKTKYPQGYLDLADKSVADLQQTKDSYRDYAALFDEFDSRVRALDPPPEISDLVKQVLDADQAVSAINHDRLTKLEAASSTAELGSIFAEDPAFTAAVDRTVELCTSLIDRAKQYDYELDLPCRG